MSALRHVLLYGVAVLGFERYRVKGIVLGVALEEGLIRDAPVPLHTGARCVGVVPAVSTWDLYGINPGISFEKTVVLGAISVSWRSCGNPPSS